jgi:hypothetical protein
MMNGKTSRLDFSCRRRGGACLFAGLLLAVTACGGEPATVSGGATTSPGDLAAVLVTPSDLGQRWTTNVPPDSQPDETPGVITDANRDKLPRLEFCAKASEQVPKAADAAVALHWDAFRQLDYATETRSMTPSPTPGDRPPQHDIVFVQEFLLSDTPATVQQTQEALASGVDICRGEVTRYPDGEVGRILPFQAPAIGDARIGWRDVVREPGHGGHSATWDLRSVLARQGGVLVWIMVAEVATEKVTPTLSRARVNEIVTTIAAKLP